METNLSVRRAEELICSLAPGLPSEKVPLRTARGRILREKVCADDDSPRFDCSAMDGYALRRADADRPLKLVGEIQAGMDVTLEIHDGEAARIFTGGRVPEGADYVAMQEDVEVADNQIRLTAIGEETNIRHRGENIRRGEIIVPTGTELRAAELAALASCGMVEPLVTRRARVVHLATGDELIDPAETPRGSELRDSNSTLVAAFLDACGAHLMRQERLPDSLEASKLVADSLGAEFDLLLVSGGASVGAYDFARPMLEHAGFEIQFQNVNLRPGKPLALYSRGQTLAFALPGNPVSHWVILNLLIAPLLTAMSGISRSELRLVGKVMEDAPQKPNRRETQVPVVVAMEGGEFRLRPRQFVSSGDVASVAGANGLLEIPAGSTGFRAGEQVSFLFCK